MSGAVCEMLWDCRHCGAQKLLGSSHCYCPACGAGQEEGERYTPREHEPSAATNPWLGAESTCESCEAPCSRVARYCGRCGVALSDGAASLPRLDVAQAVALPSSRPTAPPPRPLWKVFAPSAALVLVAVTVVLMVSGRDERLVVTGRSWSRSVSVERLELLRRSARCDEVPRDARDVTRRGVGSEPASGERCDFTQSKWSVVRREQAEGGAGEAPRWPSPALSGQGCTGAGCERSGARVETYTVRLQDGQGRDHWCHFAEAIWAGYDEGARYRGELRPQSGSLECGSLRPH